LEFLWTEFLGNFVVFWEKFSYIGKIFGCFSCLLLFLFFPVRGEVFVVETTRGYWKGPGLKNFFATKIVSGEIRFSTFPDPLGKWKIYRKLSKKLVKLVVKNTPVFPMGNAPDKDLKGKIYQLFHLQF
jgi:hypothetical protein